MSTYAYKDKEKTQQIFANECTANDLKKNFYCPTINCPAVIWLCAVGSDKRKPYFKSKHKKSHIPTCVPPPDHFDPTIYDEDSFDFYKFSERFLQNRKHLPNIASSKILQKGHGKKKEIDSLLTFYYILKSHHYNDTYGNIPVWKQLADGRLRFFSPIGLTGIKLVECQFKYFNLEKKLMFAVNTVDFKIKIFLRFSSDSLFEYYKNFYLKNHSKNHQPITVIIGNWLCDNIDGKNYLTATITNKCQIVNPH